MATPGFPWPVQLIKSELPTIPMEGEFFYAPNATTGAGHTITVGLSQTEPLIMSIAALSGDNTYSPIDAYSSITGDNGTLAAYIGSNLLTTSQPNDLLLGIVKGFGANTYTAGAGYTTQPASTGPNFSAETGTASTPGNYTSTFTASAQDFWQTVIAAIAPKPNEGVLSWIASSGGIVSTYFIERCAGLGCSNFGQIGSVPSPTLIYTDSTISPGTVYNYRVRAESSSGTFSPYSTVQAVSPVTPVCCFQLGSDFGRNAKLERIGGKWRINQSIFHREMHWSRVLKLCADSNHRQYVLCGYFCCGRHHI